MPISDIAGCICILKYVVVGVLAVRYMRETTELMFPKFLSLVRNDLEMLMLFAWNLKNVPKNEQVVILYFWFWSCRKMAAFNKKCACTFHERKEKKGKADVLRYRFDR